MSMLVDHLEKPAQPLQWAYMQVYHGREFNVVKYNKMVKEYMDHAALTQLENTCRTTNHIAVLNRILTRRQREKYSSNKIAIGRQVFYLFNDSSIPLDVYDLLCDKDPSYIYFE